MSTAKVIIKGENQISGAVRGAKNDLSGFSQAAQKVGDTLKKAFAITAVVASLKKLGDACSACFNDFSQANRAYKQLSLVMKDQSAYKSVIANIDRLSRQTLSSKGDIEAMVSELAALGKSADEINRISDAAVALSNVTGKDLNSSMTTLLNTYRGTTTQLNKLGIDTSNLTKHQLENGAAVDLVISKFSALSQSMAEADTSQHIQNIKNTFGDIKQQIGGILDYNFGPMIADLDRMLSDMFSNITGRINYIGAVIANLPQTASLACQTIWELIKRTFEWDTIKDLFLTVIENITSTIKFILENLTTTVADVVDGITSGIILEIQYIAQSLYQELLDSIYRVFNTTEEEFKNSWLGKLIDFSNTVSGGLKVAMGIFSLRPKDLASGKPNAVSEALIKSGVSDLSKTTLASSDVDAETVTEALKKSADAAFEKAGTAFADLFKNAVEAGKENLSNTAEFFTDNYSDIIEGFKSDLDLIVAPALEEIEIKADATAHAVDGTTTAVEKIDTDLKKGTFLDKLGDKIASLAGGWSKADDGQAASFGTAVIDSFCDKMGEAGEVASKLAVNMASMGPVLGAIATALEYVFEGLNQVIGTVLTDIVEYGLEPLRELGRVIGELLLPVFEALAPQLEKIMEFSKILFNAIGSVLQPIFNMVAKIVEVLSPVFDTLVEVITTIAEVLQAVGAILETVLQPVLSVIATIIKTALAPALELISVILEILSPVLKVFAKIVVTITGTIQYVVQILQHWVATVMNWLADLSIFGWHPFSGLRMNDPGSPGSYSSYIQSKWDSIDQAFEGATSLTESSSSSQANTSTTTAVTSAGYQGATQVTINIYQQAPVVGDMGMRAFAQMIRTEFEALSYYGVTA